MNVHEKGAMRIKGSEREVGAIVVGIRACFSRLRAVADALHRDLGVTAAMRAVMKTVSDGEEDTVPRIARLKRVSRQNIQVIVDGLVAAGLLELADNPAHKRSPLIVLTKRGRATFREMRRRESSVLKAIAEGLSPTAMKATIDTLVALQRRLERMETEHPSPTGEDNE
jgi:DNA-binding MarR family transcriptional regulator